MSHDLSFKLDEVFCLQEDRRPIQDADGRIIGYYEKQSNGDVIVYNAQNRIIGQATKSGTITYSGRRLSMQREPGLLFSQLTY